MSKEVEDVKKMLVGEKEYMIEWYVESVEYYTLKSHLPPDKIEEYVHDVLDEEGHPNCVSEWEYFDTDYIDSWVENVSEWG